MEEGGRGEERKEGRTEGEEEEEEKITKDEKRFRIGMIFFVFSRSLF